jgi:large subunit ribosomal protein L5
MAKKDEKAEPAKKNKGGAPPKGGEGALAEKKEKKAKGGDAKGAAPSGSGKAPKLESRLRRHFQDVATPNLTKQFGWTNKHQVPRIEKVKLNVGLGEASKNAKLLDSVVEELRLITGQKPLVTRAKKAIANFGLREGMPIGVAVTLRGDRMYHFLDRLVSVAMPRIRDFRGIGTRSFDGRGNFTFGVKEQIIFPEINFDRVQKVHGMDITIVTSTNKDDEAFALLKEMGFPFRGETAVIIGQAAA